MFIKQDWAYFFGGLTLILVSAMGVFAEVGGGAWGFSIIGLILAAIPMIQRFELTSNTQSGLSIKFERPDIDGIIRQMESVARLENKAAEEKLREATEQLKEFRSSQRGDWIGGVLLMLLAIFGIGYCVPQDSSDQNPSSALEQTQPEGS